MYVFLDTEFIPSTGGGPAQLLSVGACSMGGAEFYREVLLERWPEDVGEFVRTNVLSQFGQSGSRAAPSAEVATDLVLWVDRLEVAGVEVCYDFHADFDFFERLMGLSVRPLRTTVIPTHVGYLNGDEEADGAASRCFAQLHLQRGLRRHHALADALALRSKFIAVHGR